MTNAEDGNVSPLVKDQRVYGLLKIVVAALLFVAGLLAGLRFLHLPISNGESQICAELNCQDVAINSVADLKASLKRFHILDVEPEEVVPAVLFDHYPYDLPAVSSTSMRKKLFFHALLPVALIAQDEITAEQKILKSIISKMDDPKHVIFDKKLPGWQINLSKTQVQQALMLAKKYKSARGGDLLKRVRPVPVSLILAQAAIESAWGGSRFALAGNNIFGIWTWDDEVDGLVPSRRDAGKKHRVRSFKSLLAAVREYCLILNRQPAYRRFRRLRQMTSDSTVMARGLSYYSSRRKLYVEDVLNIIRTNNLQLYDTCLLLGSTQHV